MASRNWTCPHCNRPQTTTDKQIAVSDVYLSVSENKYGNVGSRILAIACANPECREITLSIQFGTGSGYFDDFRFGRSIAEYKLRPESSAKPQPDFIPQAIREDYVEACRIRDLSQRPARRSHADAFKV